MLEEKLNEFNIFSLRDLARRTGVKSPTSKKKDVLIKEIVEIMSGKKDPVEKGKKQGRPPKTFGYNLANVFDFDESQNLSAVSLKQNIAAFNAEDSLEMSGFLELVNSGAGLLWVLNDENGFNHYFIPNELLQNLDVKAGDKLVVKTSADTTQKVVTAVCSINNIKVSEFSKRCGLRKSFIVPHEKIVFENECYDRLDLLKGQNCYFYGENNNDNTIAAVELVNFCKIKNKIYINVSLADKNKIYLKNLSGCEMFVMDFAENTDLIKRVLLLAIERAKRLFENGEDVLLVVDDLQTVAGADSEQQTIVKNLVSLAKAEAVSGSITLFSIMPNQNMCSVEKLADVRLRITGKDASRL